METFMNGWAGLTRFVDIMRLQPEINDAPDAVSLGMDEAGNPIPVEGDIEIDHVSFTYEGKETDVIKEDLTLENREMRL